ncbi:MAG: tetratricopeptide repeat protein [Deltaproteobacteria bacterium]|nr:tetratricopeptide repeat protein [Deltaproteobacteria bacterium]
MQRAVDAQLHAQAAEHLKKSRFSQAIELYRQLLSDNPENPELRAELAEAYRRSNNAERAFHHFNRAAALYNLHARPELELKMLDAAMGVSPKEPDILFRRAECLRALGRTDLLRAALHEVIDQAKSKGDRRRLWALEQLHASMPDDPLIAFRRAEALAEADRVDEAVHAFKHISARFGPRTPDFVRLLKRAAEVGTNRPDIGADIAAILLSHGYARESLATLVPFYERFADDIRILEVLLAILRGLGAVEKVLPARIELLKARAKVTGSPENTSLGLAEAEALMADSADDAIVLEIVAHAFAAFGTSGRALEAWRRMARAADRTGQPAERDRAVLSILRADQDDEEALEMGRQSLMDAGRESEAQAFEKRLRFVRAKKRRDAEMKLAEKARLEPIARSESPTRAASSPRPLVAPRIASTIEPDIESEIDIDDGEGPEAVFTQEQSLPTASGLERPRGSEEMVRPSPWDPQPPDLAGDLRPIDTADHTDSSMRGFAQSVERGTLSLEEGDVLEVRAEDTGELTGPGETTGSFDVEVSLDELDDDELPSDPALGPKRIASEISTGEFDEERPTELAERVGSEDPIPRTIQLDVPLSLASGPIVEILPARPTSSKRSSSPAPAVPQRRRPSLVRPSAPPPSARSRTRPPPAVSTVGRAAPAKRGGVSGIRRLPSILAPRPETAPIRASTPSRPPIHTEPSVQTPARLVMPVPPAPLARTESDTLDRDGRGERTAPGHMDELDFAAFPEMQFEPEEITSKIEALIEEQTIGLAERPRPREVTQRQSISPKRLIDDLLD